MCVLEMFAKDGYFTKVGNICQSWTFSLEVDVFPNLDIFSTYVGLYVESAELCVCVEGCSAEGTTK